MSLHVNLPIYRVAYALADLAFDLIKNMPRDVKQVIGGELRDQCLTLIVLIYKANASKDKQSHLSELIERLQVVEPLLRLSRDKRFISTHQYARAIQLTDNIGRQASGWRKSAAPPVT